MNIVQQIEPDARTKQLSCAFERVAIDFAALNQEARVADRPDIDSPTDEDAPAGTAHGIVLDSAVQHFDTLGGEELHLQPAPGSS